MTDDKPEDFISLPSGRAAARGFLNWFPQWARGWVAFAAMYAAIGYLLSQAYRSPTEPKLAFYETLILLVVSLILTEYLRPKPKLENARPPGLGDYKFPTATEGRVTPLLWGRTRIDAPNLSWYGDVTQRAIYTKVKTGLWSSKTFISGFESYVAMQLTLCRGGTATVALRGSWIGDTKVFSGNVTATTQSAVTINEPTLFGGNTTGNGGFMADLDFFNGSPTQPVSDFLNKTERQRILSAPTPTAPRYTSTAYVIVREIGPPTAIRGAYVGNSTTIKTMSFDVERTPALFPGQTAGQNKIGTDGDVNPVNVLYEYLTNTEWGLGEAAADIDTGTGSSFLYVSNLMIAEVNGMSMLVDTELEGDVFLRELERQMEAIVFRELTTGKWTIKAPRADYDINLVPQFDEDSAEVRSFTQSGWEDTTSQVQVLFNDRDNDYKESFALAQDTGAAQILGGGTVTTAQPSPTQTRFPGVKNAALAVQLAWRELRVLGYPLARATFAVDRRYYGIGLGSVIAWSSERYGFTKLPMRVTAINYGELTDATIEITTVQDVFYFAAPSYAPPETTQWIPPVVELVPYPANRQVLIPAPRAILSRDPDLGFQNFQFRGLEDYLYVAAERQTGESEFAPFSSIAPTAPGTFQYYLRQQQFMGIGTLVTSLNAGEASPKGTIAVTAPAAFLNQFDASIDAATLGSELVHLILIGREFFLVTSASWSSGTLTLTNTYRGVLDSVQESHAPGDLVYFLFFGGDIARTIYHYKAPYQLTLTWGLRPSTNDGANLYLGATTYDTFPVTNRAVRPMAPGAIVYNGGSTAFATPSLEGAGSGIGGFRIDVGWWRRDLDAPDEVFAVLADAVPTRTTEYRLEVRADPLGANTLVGSLSAWGTGVGPLAVSRADILTAAPAGTLLRVLVRARHDYSWTGSGITSLTALESLYDARHDVTPTSTLTGKFYFGGGVAANVATASYTAAATGTFTVAIGAAQSTAGIQVSVNGGAFATVITAPATSGTFSATSGDTIRLRRTVNEAPQPNYVELRNPSTTVVAYGTFKN